MNSEYEKTFSCFSFFLLLTFFFFDVEVAEEKDNVAEMPARVFIPRLGTLYV